VGGALLLTSLACSSSPANGTPVTGTPAASEGDTTAVTAGGGNAAAGAGPTSSTGTSAMGNAGSAATGSSGATSGGGVGNPSSGGVAGAMAAAGGGGTSGVSAEATGGAGAPAGGAASGAGGVGGSGGTGEGGAGAANLTGTPTEEPRQSLLANRQEHSAAAVGGEVYVIGGFISSVTAAFEAYDPDTDSWRAARDFPETLHHANMAATSDAIYVLGFNRGSSFANVDGRVFRYDPSANEWTERTPMPDGTERSSSCVAVLGDDIYLFGGSLDTGGNGPSVADSSVYDTVADEWTVLGDLPEPREHCVAGAVGGRVYIVSGRANAITGVDVDSYVFDPATGEYDTVAAMPTPRGGTAGAVLGGKIYIFGGEGNPDDSNGIFHDVEAYDPSTDSWEVLPDMLTGRHGFAAAVVDDRIYLPGGATNQGFGPGDDMSVFYLAPR